MDWLHPTYLWALAAVPVAVGLLAWAAWQRRRARAAFGDMALLEQLTAGGATRRRAVRGGLVVGALLLLGIALAGPRYGQTTREVERRGIDLVVALDVSASMEAEDVAPSRLGRAKNEVKKLLGRLSGDRVGLVVFAGDGFVQCPLTTDYSAVRLFLDAAGPDLVPTPGTNFEAAFQAARQAFEAPSSGTPPEEEDAPTSSRAQALLVISDGENHVGQAAEVRAQAQEQNITLFAAGVGGTEGARIPVYEDGRQVGFKRDRQGQVVRTRLEEEVLKELAAGGAYFRIASTTSALGDIEAAMGRLEKGVLGAEQFASYREVYQWPLAGGLVLLALALALPARRRRAPGRPAPVGVARSDPPAARGEPMSA
jgi:Ca-activated chloride channel family protein